MPLMSRDKNYDYLLGCHPTTGNSGLVTSPHCSRWCQEHAGIPPAQWLKAFPVCSLLVSKQFCSLVRDVCCPGLLCPFRHVCLELLTVTRTMYPRSQEQKGKNNCRRQSPSLALGTPCTPLFLLWEPCLCSSARPSSSTVVFLCDFGVVIVPGGLALGSWLLILIRGTAGTVAGAGQVLHALEVKESQSSRCWLIPQPTARGERTSGGLGHQNRGSKGI